ncbi:MAG TPA: hypothetical protein DDW31_00195 [candidate division Zixibacteria bacterium]|jgi:hypothetical protein|nr:hypothetical protein [candidate division Zixibacteria bacterium]
MRTPVLIALLSASAAFAQTLDVTIKGLDDGRKTSRQQDYREAVLDAKRQAIEQAGVKVTSRSTVVNARLSEDFIESQAEAVILPGFQVIDIGYTADGTYQVVLSGKVQLVLDEQPENEPGVLALVMDLYSVPISFQLDGKPLDANKPFLAVGAVTDSQAIKTFASLRDFKKQYHNLLHYFVYLFRLPRGKHTLSIKASVLLGSERIERSNLVDVDIAPGQYTVYEYLAHPDYGFEAADRDFLLERFVGRNRFRDTTAAFRGMIKQRLENEITAFGGVKF